MKKHWHKIAAITLLACACVVIVYLIGSREPTFRGKAESHWITNIVYFGPEEQVNQWREFGSDGVRFLAQALDRSGGLTRTYRRFHRSYAHKLPRFLGQLLPQSVNDTSRRMSVLSLLVQLSNRNTNFAKLAEPAVARAMRDDNGSVRQLAAGFYEGTLGHMGGEVAKARLPDFVRLMQDADHGARNNAAVALSYYQGETSTAAPALVRALSEPDPLIQLTIAKSLIRVDRHAATTAGVATIAANSLKDPDGRTPNPAIKPWNPRWQIARQAAEVLGELHAEPATSIPALIEGLSATNREIAIASFRALIKFKDQAEAAIPALRKAAERQDIPHWVKAELVHLDPATAKP